LTGPSPTASPTVTPKKDKNPTILSFFPPRQKRTQSLSTVESTTIRIPSSGSVTVENDPLVHSVLHVNPEEEQVDSAMSNAVPQVNPEEEQVDSAMSNAVPSASDLQPEDEDIYGSAL